jgi:hypothetical protein
VNDGDAKRLRELVTAQSAAISQHFPAWKKVPEAVRADRERLNRYAAGLIGLAQFCAENGDPSLLALLQGPAADNPLTRWQNVIRAAQQLLAAGRHAQAEAPLREILAATQGQSGSGPDRTCAPGCS